MYRKILVALENSQTDQRLLAHVAPLAKLGAYFSFPGYFLQARKLKQRETFRQPAQRLWQRPCAHSAHGDRIQVVADAVVDVDLVELDVVAGAVQRGLGRENPGIDGAFHRHVGRAQGPALGEVLRDLVLLKLAMVELAGGFGYKQANASFTGPGLCAWDKTCWSGGSSSGPGSAGPPAR